MKYKVKNLLKDMKLFRVDGVVVIRKGKEAVVSADEYQYLSQVYGTTVKGEKEIVIRITEPAKIEESVKKEESVVVVSKKKRKHK